MDVAAAAAVADYCSNGEEGRRRSGSKMRGDAMRGGGLSPAFNAASPCAAPRLRNRSGFRVVVSLLPPPEERFSFTEKKREREGGRESDG